MRGHLITDMKHFNKLIAAIVLGSALMYADSCKHEPVIPKTEICFDTQIMPILQNNCNFSGCHLGPAPAAGHDFTTYEKVMEAVVPGDYKNSHLYQVLVKEGDKRMPKGKEALDISQINLIKIWIANGANEKICTPPPPPCDTNQFTYAAIIKPIIQTNCYECHSTANNHNVSHVNLEIYDSLKKYAVDYNRVYGNVAHLAGYNNMPKDRNKLDTCQIIQIKKWVQAGGPNN